MIYLDNNATTALDPRVHEAMDLVLKEGALNPSSIHRSGQKAKGMLALAKRQIADFFDVDPEELVFTSGATEALNMTIRSCPRGTHIITSSVEHVSVIESTKLTGCSVTYLDPQTGEGGIGPAQIESALRPNTAMIVLTAANNETGIKTDIEAIAAFAKNRAIPFVVDGVVLLGKEPIAIPDGVGAMCFSGHKIHAPAGIGLAVVRKGFKLNPLIVGGPQQRNRRGGTEPLAAIVGFAKALSLIDEEANKHIAYLRNRLEEGIASALSDVIIHGRDNDRLCNTTHVAFLGVDGETLLMHLDLRGVAASYGAACSSAALEPSRVLLNMGLSPEIVRSSIRFSLSRFTTEEEIDRTLAIIIDVVTQLRNLVAT